MPPQYPPEKHAESFISALILCPTRPIALMPLRNSRMIAAESGEQFQYSPNRPGRLTDIQGGPQ
jgi:hypothetical protein